MWGRAYGERLRGGGLYAVVLLLLLLLLLPLIGWRNIGGREFDFGGVLGWGWNISSISVFASGDP